MCKCIRSSSDSGNRWTRDSETSVDIVDDCERQVASRLSVSGAQSSVHSHQSLIQVCHSHT